MAKRKIPKKELEALWKSGNAHPEAIRRRGQCVLAHCNKKQALDLAHWFVNHLVPDPACTHYNGDTVSLYCGDTGKQSGQLMQAATVYALDYLK